MRTILQVMNHSIIVTDEMGSLRIFKYEQNIEENVNSVEYDYYQIYLEHLNDVYLCMISADCSIVVTVGRYDRSIILWKIKNFDMLMSKAMNNMNNGSSISNGKNYSSSKNKVGNSPNFKLNRINNFNDILNLTNTQNQK